MNRKPLLITKDFDNEVIEVLKKSQDLNETLAPYFELNFACLKTLFLAEYNIQSPYLN